MSDVTITITVSSEDGNVKGDAQALLDAPPDQTVEASLGGRYEGEAEDGAEGPPPLDLAALGVSDAETDDISLGDSAGPEDLEGGGAEETGDDEHASPEDVGEA